LEENFLKMSKIKIIVDREAFLKRDVCRVVGHERDIEKERILLYESDTCARCGKVYGYMDWHGWVDTTDGDAW